MNLNWLLILLPGLAVNLYLALAQHSENNRWLALLYAITVAFYIIHQLVHGVPDGWVEITLTDDCNPSEVVIPAGLRLTSHRGDLEVTRTCTIPWPRLLLGHLWPQSGLNRKLSVPVRHLK